MHTNWKIQNDLAESEQQKNNHTHSYDTTKDYGVSALSKVNLLDDTVDQRKTSCYIEDNG